MTQRATVWWIGLLALALGRLAHAAPTHVRLRTGHGPVHVWTPAEYDAGTADIVVYVHGYFVDVDGAWRSHQLASEFESAHVNALFVVCEAPSAPVDEVAWDTVTALLDAVRAGFGDLPAGRTIVVGHSAAHRTLRSWLRAPGIDRIVMLDAMYGAFPELQTWVMADDAHWLIDISEHTRPWADELHARLPGTAVVDGFPADDDAWHAAVGDARIIHVRSQVGHTELVVGGLVLPTVLRAITAR